MNFETYVEKVKEQFAKNWKTLSRKNIDEYCETEEVQEVLAERFQFYLQPDSVLHGTGSVASVAHCLAMMS
jgi:acetyl-CoA carboxylase carboxyltransferase component